MNNINLQPAIEYLDKFGTYVTGKEVARALKAAIQHPNHDDAIVKAAMEWVDAMAMDHLSAFRASEALRGAVAAKRAAQPAVKATLEPIVIKPTDREHDVRDFYKDENVPDELTRLRVEYKAAISRN